eukprot:SM000236S08006  [mRNA]  locus=s236:62208:63390:+ [translate_table: standard]
MPPLPGRLPAPLLQAQFSCAGSVGNIIMDYVEADPGTPLDEPPKEQELASVEEGPYAHRTRASVQEARQQDKTAGLPLWAWFTVFVIGFNDFCDALPFLRNVALYPTIWLISGAVVVLGHVLLKQIDLLHVLGLLKRLVLYVRYVLNMLNKLLHKLLHLNVPIQEAPLQTSMIII